MTETAPIGRPSQWARWLTRSFEAPYWSMGAWPVLLPFTLAFAVAAVGWLIAWSVGNVAAARTTRGINPPAYSCVEQSVLRNDPTAGAAFSDGMFSDAPHPWAWIPSYGLFAFGNHGFQAAAQSAVTQMQQGQYQDGANTLYQLQREYTRTLAALTAAPERVILDYHLGVAELKNKTPDSAVADFTGALKRLDQQDDAAASASPPRIGVKIAVLDGLGQALAKDGKAKDGATVLKRAISLAADKNSMISEEKNKLDFSFKHDAIAKLTMGELYADAVAANIRWVAASANGACGADDWKSAAESLRGYVDTFRANQGAVTSTPQLQADLILAAALVGDVEFLKGAARPDQAVDDKTMKAMVLALNLRPAGPGEDDEDAVVATATADIGSIAALWRNLASARKDLENGDRAALKAELAKSSRYEGARERWVGEMIQAAAAAAHGTERDRIWKDYGGFAPADIRMRANPVGVVVGSLITVLLIVAGAFISFLLIRTRIVYRRLYVSGHRRDRLRAGRR